MSNPPLIGISACVLALRHDGEVIKQVGIATIVHEPARHGDRTSKHRPNGEHASFGIVLQHLGHHARVERFVPRFIARAVDPSSRPRPASTDAVLMSIAITE